MSNDCVFNPSQKRYFTTFYSVLFYLYALTLVMLNCLLILSFLCGI